MRVDEVLTKIVERVENSSSGEIVGAANVVHELRCGDDSAEAIARRAVIAWLTVDMGAVALGAMMRAGHVDNPPGIPASQYVPSIFAQAGQTYAEMLVELSPCPGCGLLMLDVDKQRDRAFPRWYLADVDAQLKRANWRRIGTGRINDDRICTQCTSEGRGSFDCALCNERRPSDQIKESFGDPSEYLCKVCFETRTAKEWADKHEALYDRHRYDFE